MDVYLYVDADTPLHRLDPRTKFLLVVAAIVLAVAGDHPLLPATVMGLALAGIHMGRAWRSLGRVRGLVLVIFGFSLVVWTIFSQGRTRLVGPFELESLLFGISTGLKVAGTIVVSVAWLSTTRNEEITTGFIRMGLPYRVAFAFSAALRMVPTFVGAGVTIIQAQKARGVDVESGNVFSRIRKHLPLMVPVFLSALRSARNLAMALEAKGFGAQEERTYLLGLRMGTADWLLSTLAVVAMVAGVVIRVLSLAPIPGLIR